MKRVTTKSTASDSITVASNASERKMAKTPELLNSQLYALQKDVGGCQNYGPFLGTPKY